MRKNLTWLVSFWLVLAVPVLMPAEEAQFKVCPGGSNGFFTRGEKPSGLEYDILASFARANHLELVINWEAPSFFTKDYRTINKVFEQGACDLYASTITATAERSQHFDFSEFYFPVRVMLIELRGQTSHSLEELAGKKILTIEGTYLEQIAKSKLPKAKLVYLDENFTLENLVEVLSTGKADASVIDSSMAATLIKDQPELTVSLSLTDLEHFAFALAKSSPWKARLNDHLNTMKSSGEFYNVLAANFGPDIAGIIAKTLQANIPQQPAG